MLLILTNKRSEPVSKERVTEEIRKGLLKKKIKVDVCRLRDVEIFLEKNRARVLIKKKPIEKYSMVYFRKASGFPNTCFILSGILQRKRIFFIDSFRSRTNARGKLIQMFQFALNNLPIPKTYFSPEYDDKKMKAAMTYLKMPMVAKATHLGHGEMVYLAKNAKELKSILKKHPDTEMILQQFVPNDLEYRIMVFGKKAAVAEKKVRVNKKEFRSNSNFGTKEIFIDMKEVSEDLKKISIRAAQVMDIQIAGVDIIKGLDGKNYLTEVNSAPGLSLDVAESNELEKLVNYLAQCAEKIS